MTLGHWHQTIWGIVLLGAIGSILGVIILKLTKLIIDKVGNKIILRFSAKLLMPFAENRHFVEMCEKEDRYDLIIINYSSTMSRFTRSQIVFIITLPLSILSWEYYLVGPGDSIITPLVLTAIALKDFYDFIKWYLAVSGSRPIAYKSFTREIDTLKKQDKFKFIEKALDLQTATKTKPDSTE